MTPLGEASSAKCVTVTGIVIGGATQGRRNILETTNLSIRVLLPPVILLDDRFVVGMVEQKARRLVIILTTAGMLPSAYT